MQNIWYDISMNPTLRLQFIELLSKYAFKIFGNEFGDIATIQAKYAKLDDELLIQEWELLQNFLTYSQELHQWLYRKLMSEKEQEEQLKELPSSILSSIL